MGTRLKEGEKSEKLIRALLKQPANSKCINCNSRGPQYVCTTFWTFVCTTCSGIHREFTHRVKSVSMAKFTPEEISYLQGGGNERAKGIYFKEVDLHRVPDNRNEDKLRDFIKHVYVDRRYTGEKSTEKPSIVKMGNREEPYDNRRRDSYQSGSRSPPYEDAYELRHNDRPSRGYDGSSPGFDQGNQRNSDSGRSPAPIAVINDWRREDRFANGKKSEDRRSSEGDTKVVAKSPDRKMDLNGSGPPEIRPISDILGKTSIHLEVIEPPRTSSVKIPDGSTQTTQVASSNSLASNNGNPSAIKQETSLIDFDAEVQPPVTAPVSQPLQSSDLTTADYSDIWSFDSAPQIKAPQPPPNSNPLDSVLTQLSLPAPAPVFPTTNGFSAAASSTIASTPATAVDSLFSPVVQVSLTPFSGAVTVAPPASNASFLPPDGTDAGELGNIPASTQGLVTNPAVQVSQASITPSQPSSGVAAQSVEVEYSGRKELPSDLFTAMYVPQPVHPPLWHTALAPGISYSMQYNTTVPMASFPQSTKATNPFDLGSGSSPAQAPEFPPMASLQNALPNMVAPSWMPSQASLYPSGAPQLAPSFGASAMLPDPYKTTQLSSNLPLRPQGFNGYVNDITGFSSMNPVLDLAAKISATASSNPSGNPFG